MELVEEYLAALGSATSSLCWLSSHPTGLCTHPSTALCPRGSSIRRYLPTPPNHGSRPRRVFRDHREAVAFWFDFGWVLADGTSALFTVVDIAELTEDGLMPASTSSTTPLQSAGTLTGHTTTRNGKP